MSSECKWAFEPALKYNEACRWSNKIWQPGFSRETLREHAFLSVQKAVRRRGFLLAGFGATFFADPDEKMKYYFPKKFKL